MSKQDAQSTDVIIGSCQDGIFVKHKNGKAPLMFRYVCIHSFCVCFYINSLRLVSGEIYKIFVTHF